MHNCIELNLDDEEIGGQGVLGPENRLLGLLWAFLKAFPHLPKCAFCPVKPDRRRHLVQT